jgi:rRNA-processing protein FCF1
MEKILFDTNFATIPFQFRVDIYSELNRLIDEKFEILFPKICIAELEKLKGGKGSLELMEKKGVIFADIPKARTIDDSILNFAKAKGCTIATQDRELKKKALKNNLAVITLRKKQFLAKMGGK